jgi:hypothetical protein
VFRAQSWTECVFTVHSAFLSLLVTPRDRKSKEAQTEKSLFFYFTEMQPLHCAEYKSEPYNKMIHSQESSSFTLLLVAQSSLRRNEHLQACQEGHSKEQQERASQVTG